MSKLFIEDFTDSVELLEFTPVVMKLVNHDIVLTQVASLDDNTVCLMVPFQLLPEYDEYGDAVGFNFVKFVPGTEDFYMVMQRDKIVSMGVMSETYWNSYEKAVDSLLDAIKGDDEEKQEEKKEECVVVDFKPKSTVH